MLKNMTKTATEIKAEVDALTGNRPAGPAPAISEPEKIIKIKKDGSVDKRIYNGGNTNAGRKPLEQDEHRMTLKKATQEFATGEDTITRKGKQEKVNRARVVMEALYLEAKKGNVPAARELNDRFYGKAKQPITGGDEDDTPLRVDGTLDISGIGAKIYGLETSEQE